MTENKSDAAGIINILEEYGFGFRLEVI
jgi:hypothetical protein